VGLSLYWDQFRKLEPNTGTVFPATGNDMLIHLEFNPKYRMRASLQYQRKIVQTTVNVSDGRGFSQQTNGVERRQNIRAEIDEHLSASVKLRLRCEKVLVNRLTTGTGESGLLVYEDLVVGRGEGWQWNARFMFFRSDSYDSRLYEVERDVAGVLTMPGLYGRGVRWYLLAKKKISEHCELSAKYMNVIRDDVERIGTGPDELPSNYDQRLSVQLDLQL
jgi:hypothetical protein